MLLSNLGTSDVVTLQPQNSVADAMALMKERSIRHLPVVREGVPVGIVSDHDILFHVCWEERLEPWFRIGDAGRMTPATTIDHVLSSELIRLEPRDRIEDAARLMVEHRVGALPLVEDDRLTGIITETDLLRCFITTGHIGVPLAVRQKPVSDHMFANVFSVNPADAISVAVRLMKKKQVRHLPVLDGKRVVGMLSDRDILRTTSADPMLTGQASHLADNASNAVQNIMSPNVISISGSADLATAAQTMISHKIGALPVIDENALRGIISETDLLRALATACGR